MLNHLLNKTCRLLTKIFLWMAHAIRDEDGKRLDALLEKDVKNAALEEQERESALELGRVMHEMAMEEKGTGERVRIDVRLVELICIGKHLRAKEVIRHAEELGILRLRGAAKLNGGWTYSYAYNSDYVPF